MKKAAGVVLAVLLTATVAIAAAPSASAAAKFGPKLERCGKVKGKAAKRACKKRNTTTRKVFNTIKNSRFTGTLFNGAALDATFCANGKWAIDVTHSWGETSSFSGPRWKLTEVELNRRLLAATATGPSNNVYTRVGLQRRSGKWVFSDGNPALDAPAATKSSARARCQTL